MRLLITGAQGFIGRYTVAEILRRCPDAELLGIGRSPRRRTHFTHGIRLLGREVPAPLPVGLIEALDSERYAYRALDLLDLEAVSACLRAFDPTVIVHLAGALRGEPLERLLPANVAAIDTLFDAIVASHVPTPRVIHASSGSVYGLPRNDELPIAEGHPPVPFDDYSISKYSGELIGAVRARRHGIDYVRARIFNVVGPGQDERHICGHIASQIAAIGNGDATSLRLGTLSTTRDFIDVRDVARSLATLVEAGEAGGVYNVASGREVAMSDVVETMSAVAGHADLPIDPLPPRADDNPRMCADVARITSLGHRSAFSLETSCRDVLEYYRRLVATGSARAVAVPPAADAVVDVRVDRRDEYTVRIAPALLDTLPGTLASRHPGAMIALLTDERVWDLYGADLVTRLREREMSVSPIRVPAGDGSKSLETLRGVIESLSGAGLDRRGLLLALGGGMICDLGGFVASAYLRGVDYVNVPTTLLAQCDAAIGGKVAVNAPWAKNFIGAFHHPAAVFIDPLVLRTLSRRELAAGVAEIIKVAIVANPALFDELERQVETILDARDPGVMQRVLAAAVRAKVDLLAPDPYERDLRRVLNFGHTYGHPLETEHGYSGLLHGEAVAWGMLVSTALAERRGLVESSTADRIVRLVESYGLPPYVSFRTLTAALRHLRGVRLVRANKLHFVLPTAIGATTMVDEVGDKEIVRAIEDVVARLESVLLTEIA